MLIKIIDFHVNASIECCLRKGKNQLFKKYLNILIIRLE